MLRENEIKAALQRQTTAGMKLIARVRSIGGILGFLSDDVTVMGIKSVIVGIIL